MLVIAFGLSEYQSNLNEIDKSEQKSSILDSAKGGFEWTTRSGASAAGKWNL